MQSSQFATSKRTTTVIYFIAIGLLIVCIMAEGLPTKQLRPKKKHSGGGAAAHKLGWRTGAELLRQRRSTRHHWSRRSMRTLLDDAKDSALCPYDVDQDVNEQRVPKIIEQVSCRKTSCKCAESGDFTCTQLYSKIGVAFLTAGGVVKSYGSVDVKHGCVCATVNGIQGIRQQTLGHET